MKNMKILYTGGGTLGSVSPLLAIHKNLTADCQSLWLGTRGGLEKEMVKKEKIEFKAITSGKWRRYFSLQNIIDFFKILIGFFEALFIILKFEPDIIVSAGSFVAVPVIWAGWVNNVPCLIHQQDVEPGLANKLMAPAAKKITVALETSLKNFPTEKVILAGNPIRTNNKQQSASWRTNNNNFNFKNNLPLLLVMGGGTGALAVNELVWQALKELTNFCNVIHITGKNKNSCQSSVVSRQSNYKSFEFLGDEIFAAIQKAEIVVSRAGMSALTELAYFKKPTIIIPIPNSHQEKNANYFAEQGAGIYLKQNELTPEKLTNEIKGLLANSGKRQELGEKMNKVFVDYSGVKITNIIYQISNKIKPDKR